MSKRTGCVKNAMQARDYSLKNWTEEYLHIPLVVTLKWVERQHGQGVNRVIFCGINDIYVELRHIVLHVPTDRVQKFREGIIETWYTPTIRVYTKVGPHASQLYFVEQTHYPDRNGEENDESV